MEAFLSVDPLAPQPEPQLTGRSGQLAARRREALDDVLAVLARKSHRPRVVLYAATEPGEEAGPDLAACRSYVEGLGGWTVTAFHFDDCGRTVPLYERPGWKQVRASLSGGFARGVVTINRQAVALTDEPYDHLLTWLDSHRAFLDFPVRPGFDR
ncbi:hypothetical protein [Streptomyces sp. NPDC088739]|uniref:hypothetical protein n=1 Tax=Streptomyces sp. NPDC088739 TaxID=3365882 RepID=UPI003820608B